MEDEKSRAKQLVKDCDNFRDVALSREKSMHVSQVSLIMLPFKIEPLYPTTKLRVGFAVAWKAPCGRNQFPEHTGKMALWLSSASVASQMAQLLQLPRQYKLHDLL